MKMYNRILAPLDGSKTAENSLQHLEELISGCRVSEIVLLTVFEKTSPPVLEFGNQRQVNEIFHNWDEAQQQARQMAEKYLETVSASLTNKGVSVQKVLIQAELNQSVAEIILKYAEENDIDLIVMSTHGRSGITRWAFGSVADRVVRHSKIPVLTIAPVGARTGQSE
jgi:nucleotide-binding universal stress UspA family protein